MSEIAYHPIQVYYEDTDHSGLVYHANYFKFFERAREHFLGIDMLVRFGKEGVGFVVYKAEITYREGARFGDRLVVRSSAICQNEYRVRFKQDVLREGGEKVMVAGVLDLVCIDAKSQLIPTPDEVVERFGMVD